MQRLIRFASLSLVGLLVLAACSDQRELTAPRPTTANKDEIATIALPNDYVEISAGRYHTCARKANGKVFCWGRDQFGQVGNGQAFGQCSNQYPCVPVPTRVIGAEPLGGPTFETATRIATGEEHTCAISTDGTAWCWGHGNSGQLGVSGSQSSPRLVSGNLTYQSIGAGGNSTCGTSAGSLFCWGVQLTTQGWSSPNFSPVRVGMGGGFSNVSVGASHACVQIVFGAYRETDCFGFNGAGEVGIDPSLMPFAPPMIGTPFGSGATRVSTGEAITCVDQPSGIVQCIGDNSAGKLGNFAFTGASTATPQNAGTFAKFRIIGTRPLHGVATGYEHACALDVNGAAWCWGRTDLGQVGVAGATEVRSAVQIPSPVGFRAIAVGWKHTCAIGTDNNIYCWGDNGDGQLGSPNATPNGFWSAVPVQAINPEAFPRRFVL